MVDVEQFIMDNGIDEKAAIQLKELDFELQQEVLSRGMLSDARNPSAVLLSRIRQCRQQGGREKRAIGGRSARENLNDEVEEFVRANNLDERAQNCLAESDASVIRQLLATPLTDARNPSAVVLSRMRQIKQDSVSGRGPKDSGYRGGGGGRNESSGGGRGGGRGGLEREIKEFIRSNDLDERASNCIRESSEEVITILLERGPLSHARNASAMALSRIRQIQEDLKSGAGRNERPSRAAPPLREIKKSEENHTDDDWKGKGKGKGDDDYSWMWYMPPWAWSWGPWSKGGWGDWGKGDGKGKGDWGADEGKGGDSKSRAKPY